MPSSMTAVVIVGATVVGVILRSRIVSRWRFVSYWVMGVMVVHGWYFGLGTVRGGRSVRCYRRRLSI